MFFTKKRNKSLKTLILVIGKIFYNTIIKRTNFPHVFVEIEKLPLSLQDSVLKFIRLYFKTLNFLLKVYLRFLICGCFELRAFYWFAFHGVILLKDDE